LSIHNYIISTSTSLLSILQPPKSTLFPYTTLFRSNPFVLDTIEKGLKFENHLFDRKAKNWIDRRQRTDEEMQKYGIFMTAWCHGDRKSTRLNSSHVSISYAVFCLKKKQRIIYILKE